LFSGVKIDPEVEADFNKIDIFRFRLKTEEVIFGRRIAMGMGQVRRVE